MSLEVIIAKNEKTIMAYRLRFDVMCRELGWLATDRYIDGMEQDKYDRGQSLPFIAIDKRGRCVGTSRLILPGKHLFPIESHFKICSRGELGRIYGTLKYCVEVSRFIVPDNPGLKRHEVTIMLCRAMIKKAFKMGVSHAFMSVDQRFFRLLKILGFDLYEIGEPIDYMGSMTVPGILPLRDLLPKLKENKPELYEYLIEVEEEEPMIAA